MDDTTTTDHDLYIDELRRYLREAMTVAEGAVREAVRRLDELTSDQVYDVEDTDGADGEDMRVFLVDAERKIRAAAALNPCARTARDARAVSGDRRRQPAGDGLGRPRRVRGRTRPNTRGGDVMSSWGHAVRRLTDDELAARRRTGHTDCTMPRCSERTTHVTSYRYVTGRRGRVSWAERQACDVHAERFATKHGVEITDTDTPPEHASQAALRQGFRYWTAGHVGDGRPTS